MAGSWIKLRHDVLDAPEIRRAARATGLDCDQVLGKLARLWSWADRHGVDGLIKSAELEDVDEQVGHVGFGQTLVSVGWLAASELGIVIPNWERHFSDSAKARALGANRVKRHRNAPSVTETPECVTQTPLPEKRKTREELLPPLPRDGFDKQAWQALRKAWNAGPGKRWTLVNPPAKAIDRLADGDWVSMYPEAIARLRSCRFFDSPVTLNQFLGPEFVMHVLGGSYDAPKRVKSSKDFADTPPPPRAFTGEVAEAFERTRRKLQEQAT